MPLEKLHAMPSHTKGDGGYFYDAKYVGKLYQFENKIVYFTESSFQELPLEFYNTILKDCKSEIANTNKELELINVSMAESISRLKEEFNDKIKKIANMITNHASTLDEHENSISELNLSNLNIVTKENIDSMIDTKLEDVYRSYKQLSEKLVKDNIDHALKDSKREASGKMKITSLLVFKELGYTPDEIKSLAESGLI